MRGKRTGAVLRLLLLLLAVETGILAALAWTQRERIAAYFGGQGTPATGLDGEPLSDDGVLHHLFRLTELSPAPDPATAEYADCLAVCVAEFRGPHGDVPVALVMPAFLGRRWTGYQALEAGRQVAGRAIAFESAPLAIRRLNIADSLDLLDAPMVYLSEWVVASADEPFPGGRYARSLPSADETAAPPPTGPPIDLAVARGRIAAERSRIAALMEPHGDWDAWEGAARDARLRWVAEARRSGGAHHEAGAHFFEPRPEYGYAKCAAYGADAPSVALLIDLQRRLAAAGSHLLVVPFPRRDELSFRQATPPESWPAGGIVAPRRLQILDTLLAAGVDVVDIQPWLAELDARAPPFFDCSDEHPASGAVVRVAAGLAELLESYGVARAPADIERVIRRHGVPDHRTEFPPRASYPALVLSRPASELPRDASVLLIGDSYLRTPGSYGLPNSSLPDHLGWELGRHVSYVSTPAADAFQALRRHRALREAASVVVFVFNPAFFSDDRQFWTYPARDRKYGAGSL